MLVGLVVLAIGGVWGFLLTDAGQDWLRGQAEQLVSSAMTEGSLEIGELETDFLFRTHLSDVVLRDGTGREVVRVDDAEAQLDPVPLVGLRVHVPEVTVAGVHGDLRFDEEGQLDVARLFGAYEPADPDAAPFEGLPVDIDVDRVTLTGSDLRLTGDGLDLDLDGLGLALSFHGSGKRFEVRDIDLDATMQSPRQGPVGVRGDFVWDDVSAEQVDLDVVLPESAVSVRGAARGLGTDQESVDLTLKLDDLTMADVDAFVGAGLDGRLEGTLTATGPLDAIAVEGRVAGVEGTEGTVNVTATVDATTPSWNGQVISEGLRLDQLLPAVGSPLPLTFTADVSGKGSSWPDGIEVDATLRDAATEAFGVTVDDLSSGVRLREGVLHLDDLAASGPVGRIAGQGAVDLEGGLLTLDLRGEDLDTSQLRELFVPAELDGTRGDATARVRVNLFAEDVDVEVSGRIVAAPLVWTADVVARRVVGTYTVQVAGTDVTVTGEADGTEILAYGAELDQTGLRDLRVAVREDLTTVDGDLILGPMRYALITDPAMVEALGEGAVVDEGEGHFRVEVPMEEGADVVFTANADLGSHRVGRFPGEEGEVRVDMLGDALTVTAALDAGPTRRLVDLVAELDLGTDLDDDGVADAIAIHVPTLQVAPLPKQTWTASRGAGLVLTDDGVSRLDLELRSSRGFLAVQGMVGASGPLDLHVDIQDLDLSAIGELVPAYAEGIDGYAGGIVDLKGTADSPQLQAQVELADVHYVTEAEDGTTVGMVRELGARLAIDGLAGLVNVKGTVDVAGMPLARLDVAVPMDLAFDRIGLDPDGRVRGDLIVPPGPLDRAGMVSAYAPALGGNASGRVRLSGTPVDPSLSVVALAEIPAEGLTGPLRLELRGKRKAEALTWEIDAREGLALLADVRGGGTTRLEEVLAWALREGAPEPDWTDAELFLADLDTTLTLDGLPVGRLVDVLGIELDVEGVVTGNAHARGSAFAPLVDGHILLEGGRLGDVRARNTELFVSSDTETGYELAFSSDLEHAQGNDVARGSLFIDGKVPVVVDLAQDPESWVRGDLDLTVDLDIPVATASAYDPGIIDAHGLLEVDGRIEGPPLDPRPVLDARLSSDSRFIYRPIGVQWTELQLDASVRQDAVTLRTLKARTQPPPANLASRVVGLVGQGVDAGVDLVANRDDRGRGTVSASGRAAFREWVVEELDLKAELDRVLLLDTPGQTMRASTSVPLTVSGDMAFPKVAGRVRVDNAELFLDYATAMGGGPLKLDPRIVVHRGGQSTSVKADDETLLDDLSIEVGVDLGRASRGRLTMPLESLQWLGSSITALARVDIRARLGGEVTYRQVPCRRRNDEGDAVAVPGRKGRCGLYHPEMQGTIDILDGDARVLGAEFALSSSQVRFLGNEIYNPNLDISGTMKAADATVSMNITGTAYEPDVNFSSPDHPGDEFAILLLGRSPDDVGPNELAMAAFGVAAQSVLSGLNLSAFSIDPAGNVVAGLAVARGVYVEASASGSPRPDENSYEVEVEATIIEGLLVRVGYGLYAVPLWGDILFERKFD